MMDGDTPLLRIDARAEHGGGAEEHTHRSLIHGGYHRLACLVRLALLYEAYLMARDAVVLHQLALDLRVDIPSITWLIGAKV